MPPHERKVLAALRAIDDIVERLEDVMSSSEIFAALFDLELASKIRQMPGKNFVTTC